MDCNNLRLEGSIDALMSFKESVKDLNSNEFRSPPSARHWNREEKVLAISQSDLSTQEQNQMAGEPLSACTLICSSTAVSREMRCVRLGFVAPCCPSFEILLICTIC